MPATYTILAAEHSQEKQCQKRPPNRAMLSSPSSVCCFTWLPDLPFTIAFHSDGTELQEWLTPSLKESILVICKILHHFLRSFVAEEDGIWLEQAFVRHEISIVLIVEQEGCFWVIVNCYGWAHSCWALLCQLICENFVQGWINGG